jgi:hypothetical protein
MFKARSRNRFALDFANDLMNDPDAYEHDLPLRAETSHQIAVAPRRQNWVRL